MRRVLGAVSVGSVCDGGAESLGGRVASSISALSAAPEAHSDAGDSIRPIDPIAWAHSTRDDFREIRFGQWPISSDWRSLAMAPDIRVLGGGHLTLCVGFAFSRLSPRGVELLTPAGYSWVIIERSEGHPSTLPQVVEMAGHVLQREIHNGSTVAVSAQCEPGPPARWLCLSATEEEEQTFSV